MSPQFNAEQVGAALDGRWADLRRDVRTRMLSEHYRKQEDLTLHEHRERVLGQLQRLTDEDLVTRAFPESVGGAGDPGGNVAGFEEMVLADPSMQIKSGVQWGLFGGAVLHLGTKEHHEKYLPGIMDLSIPGVFAMTEIGHGSDVASLGTTATYDPEQEQFIINTPFRGAWKEFLGNAALHGIAAVVFAQLITQGVNHGVHAFYVPIRTARKDGTTALRPGVSAEDDGHKGGLNGIDNGRLAFTDVRIPRENLLNRYGDVAPDGTYSSPISSPGRRFFTMLGTLVQGRVSLSGAATVASKVALTTAIRYGEQRRQFVSTDENTETVLMDYQRHQYRLLPLVARTYASQFMHNQLLERFDDVFSGRHDTDGDRQDLETFAAASKSVATWLALEVLQEAREATGGAGFMSENRIAGLRADLDIYVTFEGDNNILLQLVGKRLLTDYGREMAKMDVAGAVRYVADWAADMTLHRTPLRRVAQSIQDGGSLARSANEVRDPGVQRELLEDRVETMISEIAMAMRHVQNAPMAEAAEVFNEHQNNLVLAAEAHAELLQWEAFTEALEKIKDEDSRKVLTWVRDLFGLGLIEKNLAWYIINGRISTQRGRTVGSYIGRLISRLRPYALDLVDAFGYTPEQIGAPIGTDGETQRQEEAREYYRRQRAAGEEPILEKYMSKADDALQADDED